MTKVALTKTAVFNKTAVFLLPSEEAAGPLFFGEGECFC